MRRTALIAFLAAGFCVGAPATPAGAEPSCTAAIGPAWVVDDDVVGWMVGTDAERGGE